LGCRTPPPAPRVTPNIAPTIVERQQTVVRFYVTPSKFYNDRYGYIGIRYQTKEEIWEERKSSFADRNLSAAEYERVRNAIPEDGVIYIHIGRKNLMHANTRYYSFRGYKENKDIFAIQGREGIPNIRCRDGNWWNIVEIPLREQINNEINVVVTDRRINREFNFKIIREES